MRISSLRLERVGQIKLADVQFGDLTVLVGPQATGKSIFLEFLKLVLDTGYVHDQMRKHGIDWKRKVEEFTDPNGGGAMRTVWRVGEFLDVYFGEGMRGIWQEGVNGSSVIVNGTAKPMTDLATPRNRTAKASAFYIPAQRVLSLANGWPRPFQGFASEDPFVVRDFSEIFRHLMDQEFSRSDDLFPRTKRLRREYREVLARNVFGGFGLHVDRHGAQKRLVLKQEGAEKGIPFMAWSAGQREFVPLLMGLYWLIPSASISRRDDLEWIVIEELEMGLHPRAISAVLLLVLELLKRGYRVCLSTHSPHVLDVVWALRKIKEGGADAGHLLKVFDTRKTLPMRQVAECALGKEARVYSFDQTGTAKDISNLDPGSADLSEAMWGGLGEFSGRVADVVADVVNESDRKHGAKHEIQGGSSSLF